MYRFRLIHVDSLSRNDVVDASVVYVNFTDGLGLIDRIVDVVDAPVVVVRLRSSHLEAGEYERFLWTVPDDTLYRLATGQHVVFVDGGSRRSDCIPRTIWQGMAILLHTVLRIVWHIVDNVARRWLAQHVGTATAVGTDMLARKVATELSKPLRSRIRYWRRYATSEPQFTLTAVYGCAALDENEARSIELMYRSLFGGKTRRQIYG